MSPRVRLCFTGLGEFPSCNPSGLFGLSNLGGSCWRSTEFKEVSLLSAVGSVLCKSSVGDFDVHTSQQSPNALTGPCILEVEVPLEVWRSGCRGPLITIKGIPWGQRVQYLLVLIGVVGPGKAEGSGAFVSVHEGGMGWLYRERAGSVISQMPILRHERSSNAHAAPHGSHHLDPYYATAGAEAD